MKADEIGPGPWPALPFAAWRDTCATLHMWMQVVGKLTIHTTPLLNHWWNCAFHLTARGLATEPMRWEGHTLVAEFDFLSHELHLLKSDGSTEDIALVPMTVAEFYRAVMAALERMHCPIRVWTMPVEVADPIAFERDTMHASYDRRHAMAFWRALESMRPAFERFRGAFLGKSSPVQFFWGTFDLALSRFSGRRAPDRETEDAVIREAYSHELICHGFWPGGEGMEEPVFYAYAAPEAAGYPAARVPPPSRYDDGFHEFFLSYEAVCNSPDPEATLLEFLQATYEAAANLGQWPRAELERNAPTSS